MPTLTPLRPSAAIRERYESGLVAIIERMQADIVRTIRHEYASNQPEMVLLAADASPARAIQAALGKLGKRWLDRFDELAPRMAEYFATAVKDRVDETYRADLRRAGMTVRFKMTAAMNDAYQAVRADNVSLIRSIAEQHLTAVEGMVMRSVQRGRDLGALTDDLTKQFGVTKRRAARIALHQNNMATTTMRVVRELELGITEGEWLHSAGGKTPRPPHVAFSRHRFPLREGHDFGDGEGKVLPGVLINCRCTWAAVMPGFDD